MKISLLIGVLLGFFIRSHAQEIQWSYHIEKIGARKYAVHLTAALSDPWHTYSQTTPLGGPLPTSIQFAKNPLLAFDGQPKEVGKLEQIHDEAFGVDVKYYQNKVDFVTNVELKSDLKTNVSGTIKYMVCTDEQCLPPATASFSLPLGGEESESK